MDEIRHIYLHYEIEPLVYCARQAMERLLPLLKAVQEAPLEYTYKTEIVASSPSASSRPSKLTPWTSGIPKPEASQALPQTRVPTGALRGAMGAYERQAEAVRRKAVDLAMRQGWVLADYFYNKIGPMEKDGVSLKENIGEMVYGMDVDRERHNAQQIAFLPQGSHDVLRARRRQLAGLQLAEMKIFKGDLAGASEIANKVLADPKGDHAQAHYVLARVNLMQRQPGAAIGDFQEVLDTSKDPRTLAWSHIYLGRLYDVMPQPDRQKAIAEYQAALAVRDAQPDTKAAAENGLKSPSLRPKSRTSPRRRQCPLRPQRQSREGRLSSRHPSNNRPNSENAASPVK